MNQNKETHLVKPNSLEHRILAMLAKEDAGTKSIDKGVTKHVHHSMAKVRDSLYEMQKIGLIKSVMFDFWTITVKGLREYHAAGMLQDKVTAKPRRVGSAVYELYVPRELGMNCMRLGAYDYMQHPSVIGKRRVWYGPGLRVMKEEALTQ